MTPIYASMFTHYLSAKTAKDADRVVRTITRQIETRRGFNYWQGLSNALVADRRGARDGQALFDAAERAKPNQQAAYSLAAQQWVHLTAWWDGLEHERLPGKSVQVGTQTIKVPRLCAERHPSGELEVLAVRFNQEPLPRHVAFGLMRIVQLAHPGTDTDITFADVPRLATLSSRGRDLTVYDQWLTEAGNDLAQLLPDEGRAQAA